MKRIIVLFCLTFLGSILMAQPQNYKLLAGTEKSSMAKKIAAASTQVSSLQCDFVQEKKLSFLTEVQKSNGKMYYKNPNCLRWEYVAPDPYIFIFNNQKIYLKNEKGTSQFNANTNRTLKTMSQLIIGTISGEGLQQNSNFTIEYYTGGKQILVKLTPVDKNIKKMISTIELYLDNTTLLATQMVMNEAGGDVTKFTFLNVQKNIALSSNKFKID